MVALNNLQIKVFLVQLSIGTDDQHGRIQMADVGSGKSDKILDSAHFR